MSRYVDALLTAARATLGIHEEGGNNRGPRIDDWLYAVGCPTGQPWCAAYVYAMHAIASKALGVVNQCPRTASSHAMWTMTDPNKRSRLPAPGDVFVLDHSGDPNTGPGHVGIVELVTPDGETIVSIEGNTNAAGSREGNQVAKHTWKPSEGKRGTLLGYLSIGPTDAELATLPPSAHGSM